MGVGWGCGWGSGFVSEFVIQMLLVSDHTQSDGGQETKGKCRSFEDGHREGL
jgi:hypothetical protein